MKKAPTRRAARGPGGELRAEYRFDYARVKPNRFASRVAKTRLVVALDRDVSEVFRTPQAVNKALRALIGAVPATTRE